MRKSQFQGVGAPCRGLNAWLEPRGGDLAALGAWPGRRTCDRVFRCGEDSVLLGKGGLIKHIRYATAAVCVLSLQDYKAKTAAREAS